MKNPLDSIAGTIVLGLVITVAHVVYMIAVHG